MNESGILVIDKPVGPTSHDVVARVRRELSIPGAGHAGTLDPMASGVLVVLLGEATKLAPYLVAHDKSYAARIALGRATTTLDAQGEPTSEQPIPAWLTREIEGIGSLASIGPAALQQVAPRVSAALASEQARTWQQPPAHSAIQVGGRRSYDRARAGEDVVLDDRPVRVALMTLVCAANAPEQHAAYLDIQLVVSKGYYVRSLARDLGAALAVPAHLCALRRTQSGPFDLGSAVALDAGSTALRAAIEPLSRAAARCLPVARLCPPAVERARQGKRLIAADFLDPPPASDCPFAWVEPGGRLVAVGSVYHVERTMAVSGPTSICTSSGLDTQHSVADEFAVLRGFSG